MNIFRRVNIKKSNESGFNVMKEFADLDGPRKMALFDCLADSRKNFYKTVTLFWPEAKRRDSDKLEAFLLSQIIANDF